jgi:CHAD domain-containing protein
MDQDFSPSVRETGMTEHHALRPGHPVGPALRGFAREIVSDARAAVDPSQTVDAVVVHEFRRAMKRWRAFMRLLDTRFGEADRLRRDARGLARALGRARDTQAAFDALADLGSLAALSARSMTSLHDRLEERLRSHPVDAFASVTRAQLQAYIENAAGVFEQWPLEHMPFDAIAASLATTFRRARRLRPRHWQDATPEELHALRRRVIEHRHQMELVTPLWPRLGRLWVEEAQRLRGRLGAYQDLVLLQGLCGGPHQPLARWRSRLVPVIARRQADHLAASARLAGRLFVERPRDFRRRLQGLWRDGE